MTRNWTVSALERPVRESAPFDWPSSFCVRAVSDILRVLYRKSNSARYFGRCTTDT